MKREDVMRVLVDELASMTMMPDFKVTCDRTNNTPEDVAAGVINCAVEVPVTAGMWRRPRPEDAMSEEVRRMNRKARRAWLRGRR